PPSRAPPAVAGLPAGPHVSDATLIDPAHGAPQLRLALTAARYGPLLKRLSVQLPSAVTVRTRSAALLAGAGGRPVRGDVRPVRGGFAIDLSRSARELRVTLAAPGLTVARMV